jgi:hypothetical protein
VQNLIYLILIVLSAGAGYMAGSWSGKDAKQALESAKVVAEKVVEKRDTFQAELDAKLKERKAEHDAELAQRDAKFAAATVEFNKKVSDREGRITALERSARGSLQRADELSARLASAKPEEVPGLKAEIAALQAKARTEQAESRGNVCVKERVPADLLAELRVETL